MSPTPIIQPSMAGGELAPSLYARVDMARYQTSLKLCRNFISQVYGGVKNRAGTRMVAETKGSGKVRLIPFVFNQDQAYVLELGEYSLRAYTDGGQLAGVTNQPNNGTMTPTATSPYTLVASKDTFAPSDVGRKIQIALTGFYDTLTITGFTNSKTVTATGTANYTSLSSRETSYWKFSENPVGTVIFETATPWPASELSDLVFTQSADALTVVHPSHPPQDIRRLTDGTFEVRDTQFLNGPFQEVNTNKAITMTITGTSGTVTVNASRTLFAPEMVGQLLYFEPMAYGQPWAPGKAVVYGDIRMSDGKYYSAYMNGTTGTIPPSHDDDKASDGAVDWIYLHSGFGIAKISSIGTLVNGKSFSCTAAAQGVLPDGLNIGTITPLTATSFAVSPADASRVRVVVPVAHGLATDATVNYTATV